MRIFFNPPEKSQTRQVLLLNQPRHLDICYQEWPDTILPVIVFDSMKIYFSLNPQSHPASYFHQELCHFRINVTVFLLDENFCDFIDLIKIVRGDGR